jgi:ribonuclease HI
MKIYVDGGNAGGIVSYGWWTDGPPADEGYGITFKGKHATNNVAEYTAVAAALIHILTLQDQPDEFTIVSDSELTVNQLNGEWRVKAPHLRPLAGLVHMMMEALDGLGIGFQAVHMSNKTDEIKRAHKLAHKTINEELKERRPLTQRLLSEEDE